MAYRVVRTAGSSRDFATIIRHLAKSYIALGEPVTEAFEQAERRTRRIEAEMLNLANAPYQGTLLPDLLPGIRCVTKDRAIFYFQVDEAALQIKVLAVFFSGQDHRRHIIERLKPDLS